MSINWAISKSDSLFLLGNQFSIPSFKIWNTTPWIWLMFLFTFAWVIDIWRLFYCSAFDNSWVESLAKWLIHFQILSIHFGDGPTFLGWLYHMSTNFLQNLTILVCVGSSQTIFNYFLNKCIIMKITSHVIFTLLPFHRILSSSTSLKPKRKSPCNFTEISLQCILHKPTIPTIITHPISSSFNYFFTFHMGIILGAWQELFVGLDITTFFSSFVFFLFFVFLVCFLQFGLLLSFKLFFHHSGFPHILLDYFDNYNIYHFPTFVKFLPNYLPILCPPFSFIFLCNFSYFFYLPFLFFFLIMMGSMIKPKALSSFEYLTHTFHLGTCITHLLGCLTP